VQVILQAVNIEVWDRPHLLVIEVKVKCSHKIMPPDEF
jgi:hypothetical protein